jgi:RND family efflux transporter MFP subunit
MSDPEAKTTNPVGRPRRQGSAAVLALLALAGSAGCGGETGREASDGVAAAPAAVTVATAAYREVAGEVLAAGSVEPSRRATPGSKILGRVDEAPVAEGERVAAGQLLARLESRDLQASVRQAEAAVAGVEARLESSRAQYARMTELQARGSATAKNLEDATSDWRSAEAAVEQAQASLAAARITQGYAELRSPLDGWVVAKEVEVGDMVQPGRALFTIEDLDPAKVIAEVPESEIRGFAPGDRALVEVAAMGYLAEGRIERIVPSGDRLSRTFRFEVVLPNPEGTLKSGMFARVTLPRAATRPMLLVPRSAVVRRGGLEGVFVVDADRSGMEPVPGSGTARLRWLRTGETRGDEVAVLSGLEEGERYVVEPPAGLADGAPVEVRPEARR